MFKYLNHDLRLLKLNKPIHFFAEMPHFRLGAQKGFLIKIRGENSFSGYYTIFILFWEPSLKDLGAHSKIGLCRACNMFLHKEVLVAYILFF